MFYYLLMAAGGFLAIFFLRITRTQLYRLAKDSLGLLNVLLGSEDDEIKLELMQKATSRTLMSLISGILLILVAAGILSLPFLAVDFIPSVVPKNNSALWEILAISAGASIPFFLPLQRTPSNYPELSVLLHHLILDHYNIGIKLFKREAKITAKKGVQTRSDFVIVTGLARAGTTSMMNMLAAEAVFSSLSYANMPFLLSPRLWERIYTPKKDRERERSHKDGVSIGLRSAEALEEYFFKAISHDSYISEHSLSEYELSPDDYADYLSYQAIVRKSNQRIYLAKNNNFILRYQSVRSYNQDFIQVLMFRHPLFHTSSLLEKHRQYQKLQQQDSFVLDYMNWLGHHEFGLNQKVFVFDGQSVPLGNKEELDFWLRVWTEYYKRALKINDQKCLFVHYEDFCQQPDKILNAIVKAAKVDVGVRAQPRFINRREIQESYSEELLSEAIEIYEQLITRSQIR